MWWCILNNTEISKSSRNNFFWKNMMLAFQNIGSAVSCVSMSTFHGSHLAENFLFRSEPFTPPYHRQKKNYFWPKILNFMRKKLMTKLRVIVPSELYCHLHINCYHHHHLTPDMTWRGVTNSKVSCVAVKTNSFLHTSYT